MTARGECHGGGEQSPVVGEHEDDAPATGERGAVVRFSFEGDAHAALCVQSGEGAGIQGFAGLHGQVALGPFVALLRG